MATLNIEGKRVQVDDSFLKLAPDQQQATVDEIASSFGKPGLSAKDTAIDVAKSGGVGLAKGGIGLAGLPGDLGSLISSGYDKATEALGVPKDTADTIKSGVKNVAGNLPVLNALANAPGSEKIQKTVEGVTGEFYKPQSVAGEYAQTFGEFAPAAIGGPGGLIAKGARVAVPAFASETAGQLTKGTEAEPYARIAAALTGGLATARTGATSATPTKEQLFKESGKGYESARNLGVEYTPHSLSNLGTRVTNDLAKIGIDADVAPKTAATLARLQSIPPGSPVTYSNVENLRKKLGNLAGSIDGEERKAAMTAKKAVDDFLENPQFADVVKGDALGAGREAKTARANNAAAQRAKELDKKEVRAELRASAANSGQNVANTMRQRIADMLIKNKESPGGFNADELAQMERVVGGTKTGNTARYIGDLLGGGGGLGQAVVGGGAAAAAYSTGDPHYLALPLVGVGARALSNASTMRQVGKLNELVRSRSPMGEAISAATPKKMDPRLEAIVKALLAQQSTTGTPLNMPAVGTYR